MKDFTDRTLFLLKYDNFEAASDGEIILVRKNGNVYSKADLLEHLKHHKEALFTFKFATPESQKDQGIEVLLNRDWDTIKKNLLAHTVNEAAETILLGREEDE